MRKTEIILLVVIFVSSIFILNGITEITNTIVIFSSMLLAILYFLFGFLLLNNKHIYKIFSKSTYQDLNALKITMGVILGLILSNILTGLLFKLMLWPGANAMLMVSGLTIILGLMFLVIVNLLPAKLNSCITCVTLFGWCSLPSYILCHIERL